MAVYEVEDVFGNERYQMIMSGSHLRVAYEAARVYRGPLFGHVAMQPSGYSASHVGAMKNLFLVTVEGRNEEGERVSYETVVKVTRKRHIDPSITRCYT